MKVSRLVLALSVFGPAAACHAADITCPPTLPSAALPDAGKLGLAAPWETWSEYAAPALIDASVYTGPPRDGGLERPQSHRPGAKRADGYPATDYVYDLTEYQPPWLACSYSNTQVALVRPLAGATTCISTLAPQRPHGPPQFISMVCR